MENPNGDYGDVSRGLIAPYHGHVYHWSVIQKWQ